MAIEVELVPKWLQDTAGVATGGSQAAQGLMSKSFEGVAKGLSTVASVAGVAIPGLTEVGAALDMVFQTVTLGVSKLVGFVTENVAAFNPAVLELWNQSLSDLSAVIGRELMPVMDALNQAMRAFADVVAALMPIFRPIITWLSESLKRLAEMLSFFGNILNFFTGGGSSVGASAKGASAVSLEEHGRQLQLAAFGMASPEQRTAQATEAIQKMMEDAAPDMKRRDKPQGFSGQK